MKKSKLLLALYAVTTGVYVNLVGRLMVAEIIALFALPFINIGRLLRQYNALKVVLASLATLLLVQILSDIANNSSPYDYLRGWSVIIFSMASIIFLVNNLSKSSNGIVYYLFALMLLRLVFTEEPLDIGILEENTNFFKVRFVGFLNPAMLLLGYFLYTKNKIQLASLSFLAFGLICMVLDARSNGLIFLISGMLLYAKSARIRLTGKKVLVLSIVLSGLFYAGYVYYVDQVLSNNIGGSNAKIQMSKMSNPYNPLELLFYGRIDSVVLIYAGLEKPIFGYGSWGKDPGGKYALLTALLTEDERVSDKDYINAHSIIFGYFAYAGVLGLLSISFLFFKLFSYASKIYKSNFRSATLPIVIVLSVDILWTFFFSPIGALRTTFPIFASLIIVEYKRYEFYKSQNIKKGLIP